MAVRDHGLFRKLDRPASDTAHSGCYVDGSTGPGVDTGVYIDFEGTLFLSLSTIKELAEVAGYSVNAEGEQLEHDNAFLTRELAAARDLLAAYEEQLNAVALAVAHASQKGK